MKEVGFEECLQYVKGADARLFLKFVHIPMGFLRSWVGMLVGMGNRNILNVGPLKSPLSMFCLSVHHKIPRDKKFLPA